MFDWIDHSEYIVNETVTCHTLRRPSARTSKRAEHMYFACINCLIRTKWGWRLGRLLCIQWRCVNSELYQYPYQFDSSILLFILVCFYRFTSYS